MTVNLFLTAATLSITGSMAYILLKLLVTASKDRLSQSWRYHGAVAVPLLFVLPLYKLWALVPIPRMTVPSIIAVGGDTESVRLPSAPSAATEFPLPIGTSNGRAVIWAQALEWAAALWLLVTIGLILWSLWRLLRCRRLIERTSSGVNDCLQRNAREAARLVGVTGEIRLLASPLALSPMLIGFLRPTIVLPSERLPNSDARFIMAHELTHFRRGDLWKKFLVNMIQCIHWCNPIIHLLSRDFAYWMETSCDERIVSSLDYAQRKEYGYLLINYAPASRHVGPRLYVSFATCRYKLKRRISTMLNSNKKSRSLLGLALAVALMMGCLSTAALAANLDIGKGTDSVLSDVKGPIADVESAMATSGDVEAVAEVCNDVPNNGPEPLSDESSVVDVDSAILDELGRSKLVWSNQKINYDSRMRFRSSYSGGYFTLSNVTATFTVTIADGDSETIEIDWYDSEGNSTVLYTGTTDSATVSYTATGREQGNFRVWNKSAAAITVDASISY